MRHSLAFSVVGFPVLRAFRNAHQTSNPPSISKGPARNSILCVSSTANPGQVLLFAIPILAPPPGTCFMLGYFAKSPRVSAVYNSRRHDVTIHAAILLLAPAYSPQKPQLFSRGSDLCRSHRGFGTAPARSFRLKYPTTSKKTNPPANGRLGFQKDKLM